MSIQSHGGKSCAGSESERWAIGGQRVRNPDKAARIAHSRAERVANGSRRSTAGRLNGLYYGAYTHIADRRVREALLRNIPSAKADVADRLARLARDLKAIDPTATAASHAEVVGRWREIVAEAVCPKVAASASSQFETAYTKAAAAFAGDGVVAAARALLVARHGHDGPCGGRHIEHRKERVYMSLIYLARVLNRRLVAASCRMVAAITGFSPATSARLLKALEADGDVKVAVAGKASPFARHATVYDLTRQLPEMPDTVSEGDRVRIAEAEVTPASPPALLSSLDVFGELVDLSDLPEGNVKEGATCVSVPKCLNPLPGPDFVPGYVSGEWEAKTVARIRQTVDMMRGDDGSGCPTLDEVPAAHRERREEVVRRATETKAPWE